YYMGQPIEWDGQGELLQKLTLETPTQISPANPKAGEVITITPATYLGTGPIVYMGVLKFREQVVATRNNQEPFQVTLPDIGDLTWTAQAKGLHPSDPELEQRGWFVGPANIPQPEFVRQPSITPTNASVGDELQIDPGQGIGLTWKLVLDNVDVSEDVLSETTGGVYIPDRAGQLILTSVLYDRGVTREVTITVGVIDSPVSLWDVQGGDSRITFNKMPDVNTINVSGGIEWMSFEETEDA
ncbi:MAG: hypothetical protein FJY85_02415, partial [Deltaproteobacteria bacterium]|nr:hypothetical protein [Deltaproteobacteria bacterium]